ncbi:restriction endonuclease [Embleya sp. NPDC059259]|uniref:restriction endonuclease n=1 Tax=unclassified Embleya TaxID=2699296 RepID=UPI0036A249E0
MPGPADWIPAAELARKAAVAYAGHLNKITYPSLLPQYLRRLPGETECQAIYDLRTRAIEIRCEAIPSLTSGLKSQNPRLFAEAITYVEEQRTTAIHALLTAASYEERFTETLLLVAKRGWWEKYLKKDAELADTLLLLCAVLDEPPLVGLAPVSARTALGPPDETTPGDGAGRLGLADRGDLGTEELLAAAHGHREALAGYLACLSADTDSWLHPAYQDAEAELANAERASGKAVTAVRRTQVHAKVDLSRWREDPANDRLGDLAAEQLRFRLAIAYADRLLLEEHAAMLAARASLLPFAQDGEHHLRRLINRTPAPGSRPQGADYEAMTPMEFETHLAMLCDIDGCTGVEVVGGTGDLGADVTGITPDGRRLVVQAKRYREGNRVGSPDVQRFGGTCFAVHRADVAVLVTSSEFTDQAIEYARQTGVRLFDRRALMAWESGTGPVPWH